MKLSRHFLDHWLHAFEKSRIDNHRMVASFVMRMESKLLDAARTVNDPSAAYQMGGGWRSSPDARQSLWQTLLLAWQERGYLLQELPCRGSASMWLVADDRRSGFIEDWKSIADQLRTFGDRSVPPWLTQWQAEGRRLICFTPNLVALRPSGRQETTHLSYLSLFAVPLAWPSAFIAAACRMLANQPLCALFRRKAWITSLLAASFDVLLSYRVPDRLLMITSNSFVIELLRYMLLGSAEGEGVTEVLHGVPSLEVEAYHQNMMAFNPGLMSGRLTFVPPVPSLQVNSLCSHIRILSDVINLKMNAISRQRDLLALAQLSVQRSASRGGFPVVALNGAGTVEGQHYLKTGCFAAEQAILRHVMSESRRQGISVHLQYSLHPAHIKNGDAEAIRAALADESIEVLEDSFQTWLDSNLCISLFSSASWDALALGCDVVFGVSPDDQLYSSGMISSFSHPTREQNLFEVISEAISRLPLRSDLHPLERLMRVFGRIDG